MTLSLLLNRLRMDEINIPKLKNRQNLEIKQSFPKRSNVHASCLLFYDLHSNLKVQHVNQDRRSLSY